MFIIDKIKRLAAVVKENEEDLIIAVSFALIAVIGFGLGRLSVLIQNKTPIRVEKFNDFNLNSGVQEQMKNKNIFIGSKTGDKYHLPDCPGAKQIKEENKIFFNSREEAEKLGYKPADNCQGL